MEEGASAATPISSYFASLLGWRPRSIEDAILLLDDEDATVRTSSRFMDARTRMNECPLGAAALSHIA